MWWTIGSVLAGAIYLLVVMGFALGSELQTRMTRSKHERLVVGKLVSHATPSSARDYMGMYSQLNTMSMTQLLTGTLAGIGGALLVNNGYIVESPSWTALLLITGAMGALISVGTFVLLRQQRPLEDWVRDGTELFNWLVDVRRKGVRDGDLDQLWRMRQRFVTDTGVGAIKTVTDAAECGIQEIEEVLGEHPKPTRQDLCAYNYRTNRITLRVLQPTVLITALTSATLFLIGTPESSLVIMVVLAGAALAGVAGCVIMRLFLVRSGRADWILTAALFRRERAALRQFDELYERVRIECVQPSNVDILTARVETLTQRVESLLATAPRRRRKWSWRP